MEELQKTVDTLERCIDKMNALLEPKGKVHESIFSGETAVIPMADVQHVEKHWYPSDKRTIDNHRGIQLITKHTRWDMESDTWANNIYLSRAEADKFMEAWTTYRFQLEGNLITP